MQQFQIGDRLKFRDGVKVPFHLNPDQKLVVSDISPDGFVRLPIGTAAHLWIKQDLFQEAGEATGVPE